LNEAFSLPDGSFSAQQIIAHRFAGIYSARRPNLIGNLAPGNQSAGNHRIPRCRLPRQLELPRKFVRTPLIVIVQQSDELATALPDSNVSGLGASEWVLKRNHAYTTILYRG
jgi:hypothetical protein